MTYTIEKVTTLIGARRYGDKDTNIGFARTKPSYEEDYKVDQPLSANW